MNATSIRLYTVQFYSLGHDPGWVNWIDRMAEIRCYMRDISYGMSLSLNSDTENSLE
jgi:hypothetical protein